MALEQSIVMGIALVWLFVRALERQRRARSAGPSATPRADPLTAAYPFVYANG